jgi:hypothetical protein
MSGHLLEMAKARVKVKDGKIEVHILADRTARPGVIENISE